MELHGSARCDTCAVDSAVTFFKKIQAVSFDVGGTLIEPWPSVGHVYAAVAREVGVGDFDPEFMNAQFAAAWRTRTQFDYTRASWADLVVSACGGTPADFGVDSVFFNRLYDRFTQADAWRVYEDVQPALEAFTGRGYRLAAVSNWDDRLRPLLRNLNLDRYFDAIEVSGESGFHKPHPEIFHRAARALGVRPQTIVHVGDSRAEDFEGAKAAGLHARLLRRRAAVDEPEQMSSLTDLVEEFLGR